MPLSSDSHIHLSSELTRAQLALGEAQKRPDAWAHEQCLERERAALQVASVLSSLAAEHAEVIVSVSSMIETLAKHQKRLDRLERLERNPFIAWILWVQNLWG